MINISSNKIILSLLLFQLIFTPLGLISQVHAVEMPTTNSLGSSITQTAIQNTNTITPQTAFSNLTNTGDKVKAQVNNNSNSQTEVQNNNTATVDQSVNATANTGDNEASRNISIGGNAGIIHTGNATVDVLGIANTNNNATGISGNNAGTNSQSYVTNTGNALNTSTSANSNTTTAVQNGNKTVINQSANTSANTGGNVADRNISIGGTAGLITTGQASTNTTFLVAANGNVALVGGDDNGNGPGSGASIVLANTGNRSRFGSQVSAEQFMIVDNTNTAAVNQSCGLNNSPGLPLTTSGCTANTGDNSSNRGIAFGGNSGVINTSDATVNAVMYANANKNTTGVNNGNGPTYSEENALNTGDNTSMNNSLSSQNNTEISNSNNAAADQNVNAIANTGRNTANRNISIGGNAGVINTGNAKVNVLMLADLNSNATGIGSTSGASIPLNFLGLVNSGNHSQINSSNSSNSTTSISNNNLLGLFQGAVEWVNTGFNRATDNIGS